MGFAGLDAIILLPLSPFFFFYHIHAMAARNIEIHPDNVVKSNMIWCVC